MKTSRSNMQVNLAVLTIALSFLLTNPSALFGQEFVAYSAAGIDATAIQTVVDAFRGAVGSPNGARFLVLPEPVLRSVANPRRNLATSMQRIRVFSPHSALRDYSPLSAAI